MSRAHSSSHSQSWARSKSGVRSRYEESDFPTKADYGEGDEYMIPREVDLNEQKDKSSGWTNPLSWEDNGDDDDSILNMGYDHSKLKEEEHIRYEHDLDQDIKDTLENEALSVDLVAKSRIKWKEYEEQQATEEAAEEEASKKSKSKKSSKKNANNEEENPKASVAGEKENTKKAPKNTVAKKNKQKAQEEEKPAEKEEAPEGDEKSEEGEAAAKPAKEEKKGGKAKSEKKQAAKEAKPAEDADEAEEKPKEGKKVQLPNPVKISSAAQVTVTELSDQEINYIQKRINDAETTDLLDQDLSQQPQDF